MDEYFKSLYQKLRDDPVSNRPSNRNCFIPRLLFPHPSENQVKYPSDINSQLYLTSLRSYNSTESHQLCRETHQLAVEASLYNEWMRDVISSLNQCIRRIDYLDKRMKT
ncbi:hypothetical protein WA588_005710, partial [Blastocystis sp. NMH]